MLCTAQSRPQDRRLMAFSTALMPYHAVTRQPSVGSLIAVRRSVNMVGEPSALGASTLSCGNEEQAIIEGLGPVRTVKCRDEANSSTIPPLCRQPQQTTYLVEGLAGYDPALRIALAAVVSDLPPPRKAGPSASQPPKSAIRQRSRGSGRLARQQLGADRSLCPKQ